MYINKACPPILLLVLALSAPRVFAAGFQCSINSVLKLSDHGAIVTHGWSANYLNREFTVERETGKVTNTTALKVRLSNYNADSVPHVLDYGDNNNAFKAVTLYEDTGRYAVLEINNINQSSGMPFIYHTNIGMILTGICDATGS